MSETKVTDADPTGEVAQAEPRPERPRTDVVTDARQPLSPMSSSRKVPTTVDAIRSGWTSKADLKSDPLNNGNRHVHNVTRNLEVQAYVHGDSLRREIEREDIDPRIAADALEAIDELTAELRRLRKVIAPLAGGAR
jgi:hypothetical protein